MLNGGKRMEERTVKKVPQKTDFEKAEKWNVRLNVCRIAITLISLITIVMAHLELEILFVNETVIVILLCLNFINIYGKCRFSSLYRRAEETRRKGFLDNAFGTKMVDIESEGYYDTEDIKLGFKRFLANLHENCFYSSKISEKMFAASEKKLVIGSIIVLVISISNFCKMQVVVAIIDLLIAADVLEEYRSLKTFSEETNKILDECIDIWNSYSERYSNPDNKTMARIMKAYSHYETTLAYESIMLDGKIFNNINEQLEKEWEGLKKRYGMKEEE